MRRLSAVALLFGALGLRVWWRAETEAPLFGPSAELVVPAGASTQAIAERLGAAGLIRRPWTFALLVRLRGDDARMKAGRYHFDGPYSLLDIEQKLVQGDVERREITFTEGKNIFEMAESAGKTGLSGEAFLEGARDPSSISDLDPEAATLEGYLFPETYEIKEGAGERILVGEMVKYSRGVFAAEGLGTAGRSIGGASLTLRQIVTLASIVELETAAATERPRIAGVFLNRLRMGMKLQTDPTVIYALKLEGRYHGNIRKVDLSSESPYNTYRFGGLPPGPIGSPGRSALAAVLRPEETEDLYFVSRNDGTHVFSKTLRDHERAVDAFQRRRPAKSAQGSDSPSAPAR
ncbi:MAG: endolytic transglycosylase MltG [Vicinamibacteria bacterium]|nr:endolytic transglycosylase MltG [Vicinamibacteria bacterium]